MTNAICLSKIPADGMIGSSPAIERTRELIGKFADSNSSVLITGETGAGKEMVARSLVERSVRRNRPFVVVDCGTVTGTTLESELFGHERGAFTGAGKAAKGLFAEAGDGTIFLDEIGDIAPPFQRALLRVLELGEMRPVGSARVQKIRCRVLAATNADLGRLAGEGKFRLDLFYRLQRLCIHIPPLRERQDDIPLLARHFLQASRGTGRRAVFSSDAVDGLLAHEWPGNIRELKNVIERMCLLHPDKSVYTPADLGPKFQSAPDRAETFQEASRYAGVMDSVLMTA